MTQLQLQQEIGNWVINFAFWPCLAFPVITSFFWDWRSSWWGRNIVILELLLAVAMLGGVIRTDLGFGIVDPITSGWLTLASVALIPVVIAHRTWLIWRAQRSRPAAPAASRVALEGKNDTDHIRRRD